ncbi:MAG TPA: hypothetical protein VHM19_19395, partial [Polyangiales bacterium]|nr:hypothetical protein [Polyangiales bacterium]
FLYERVWKNFFAGAFPQSRIVVAACAAAVVLGVVAMLREQRTRPFALALLACIAQAFLLAARKLYPLGGYRLDLYLHPVHLLFSIAGLAWLLERLPLTANEIACGVLAAGLLWFLPGMGMPVQSYHDGKLASRYLAQLEHDKRDGDLVLIYPKDFYVTALYSHWKIVVHGRHHKTGYDIASKEPGVRILPWAVNHGLDKYLRAELAAKPARLFYFAVQRDSHIDRQIEDEIRRTGYRVTRRQLEDDTKLMTYERKLKSVSTP